MRHAMRMARGVLHRQHSAPGMAEQRDSIQSEVLQQPLEVLGLGFDRNVLGGDAGGGPAATRWS